MQGYLDIMGIPYSSCSMTSSVITFDKISTKRAVAVTGVGLARERFIRRGDAVDPDALAAELGLPLFVKPNASGSSFGVTRVERAGEIPAAVERAFAESDEVLVEECIRGREMGCGVLIAGGREYLLPITEIRPKKEFFDFQAKYEAGYSDEITPAEIAPQTAAELHRLALAAYKACRCRGHRARGFHRHARRPSLPDRDQHHSRHERRQHRTQAGARRRHDAGRTLRPHHRRHVRPQAMIEIDDKIVSLDLLRECFACDLSRCKGICCVEGNAGAPLEIEEVATLEAQYETYKPYMTPEGIAAVERQGFMVVDDEGDYTTPLVGDAECAYSYTENGVTLCAVERAFREGRCSFRKPISCHLYPIRVVRFSNGTLGLNYHRWEVCRPAVECGRRLGIPVYKALRGADRAAFQRRVLPGARSGRRVPARTGAKTLILIQRN